MGWTFHKRNRQLVYNFNASISFDQKFYKQDIRRQHGTCEDACKTGHSDRGEKEQILEGLEGILADVESGKLDHSRI